MLVRCGQIRVCQGVLSLVAVAAVVSAAWGQESASARLRQDVETLCSEAFEGRGQGTQGLAKAATLVEERFRSIGLRPLGEAGFRQEFKAPDSTTVVNVIGVLGGTAGDSAASQAAGGKTHHMVLAAHYDHLGRGALGSANQGQLHPGADDNASGVAVLLECARRLREQEPPAHAVVFIAFGGEESGLLGSAHYVEHPVLPLGECIAVVNLDTVGRLFGNPLTVFGTSTAQQLPDVLRGVNTGFGFDLQLPEKDPGGSDQKSFVGRGVPAIQLFTGANADYHRPGDTPDKLDYAGLERIAGFTSELVRYLADRDEPLTFVPPGATSVPAPVAPKSGSRRVTFGSIPDFNDKGEGVLLSGVIAGSPAEKVGLRAGDRIVGFAGVAVTDLASYSEVLKTLSPGDEAEVTFVRDGKRQTVQVKVVERK